MYLFANEGENHTNNVKQLENMKKAMEDASAPAEAAKIKKMLEGFKIPAAGEEPKSTEKARMMVENEGVKPRKNRGVWTRNPP